MRPPRSDRAPRAPRALAAGLLALLALAPAAARAAPPAPLPVRLEARDGRLLASFDLSSVFTPSLERQLGNGLTNVIALWAVVLPEEGGEPVALHGRVLEILYDVWEETYTVLLKEPRAPAGVRQVLPDFAALLAALSEPRAVDLGPVAALPAERLVLEVRVELNPVSKEQLQRTREYIANPPAGTRAGGAGASRSVLGAVASFLLREPDPGSAVHRLRSRPFLRTDLGAR